MSNPESVEEFQRALRGKAPPDQWGDPFKALWWDACGHWEEAHEIAQELTSSWGAWMHAYLHRKQGDLWNARYWYRMSGTEEPKGSLEQERTSLLESLLL